jgi:hypothetical protein
MKDLIMQPLREAIILLDARTPSTKLVTQYKSIADVKPQDIIQFMKDNNIPDNAEFGGKPNGDDGFDEVCLCYDIPVFTTDKEKLKYKKERFSYVAWTKIFKLLTNNGYKRVGVNSGEFKQFDDTTIYDMVIDNDIDRLEKYYSLFFKKIEQ